MEAPGLQRLAQGEEVLLAPVPAQAAGDLRFALLAAEVPQPRQCLRIAFPREDGVEDGQPGLPGDVGDGVVQLDVHLVERLLHPQQMLTGCPHQSLPVAHQRAHRADRRRGTERGIEKANAVEVLEPLAVLHIALSAGHVLDVAGVDQANLETAILEDLEQRDPVDPGSLHGHGGDATVFDPVGQLVEIPGQGAEVADGLGVAIRGHRHVVDVGSEIDAGGIRVGCFGGWIAFLPAGSVGLLAGHGCVGQLD